MSFTREDIGNQFHEPARVFIFLTLCNRCKSYKALPAQAAYSKAGAIGIFTTPQHYTTFLPRPAETLDKTSVVNKLPSQNETFSLIANVFVSGNPSLYKPTLQPDKH